MAENSGTSHTSGTPKRRRYRTPISCQPCRQSKLRCDRKSPCNACRRKNCLDRCKYFNTDEENSATTRSLGSNPTDGPVPWTLSPQVALHVVNGDSDRQPGIPPSQWDGVLQRPIDQIGNPMFDAQDPFCQPGNVCFPFSFGPRVPVGELLSTLPRTEEIEYLVTQYFVRISPFFHILHGPTFQKQFQDFVKDPNNTQVSWLSLLYLICSATVMTMEDSDPVVKSISSSLANASDTAAISYRYRAMAMMCLCQDNFLIRFRLSTLEALLLLIYTISHNEGVERSWVLLGMALNIGIALKCNATKPSSELNCVEIERRRRCWAGVLMLHTYQAILFKDVDMSLLLNIQATMPADVNDNDILEDKILQPSTQPTQMSVMKYKIQLFEVSSRICKHLANGKELDEGDLERFDEEVAKEQRKWASTLLIDGSPSLLDTASYALWCTLELYAHQLYLLLHRPFSRSSNAGRYRLASRMKCVTSSAALLDIHRKLLELPRLRYYRWYAHGMSGSCAVHGAVTLASCLLEETDKEFDPLPYKAAFDAAVHRLNLLQNRSPICVKAYPVLRHLKNMLSPEQFSSSTSVGEQFGNSFDDWIDATPWLNPESINWEFWDDILTSAPG